MSQSAMIKSVPRAFRMMKGMQAQGFEWGVDYRAIALLPLLVALGFRADGRKDIIDYRLAVVESAS